MSPFQQAGSLTAEVFLDDLGIQRHKNINQFWSYIDSKFPRAKVNELEHAYVQLEKGDESSFYFKIFQDFETSMDFVALRRNLYIAFLSWLPSVVDTAPKVIVDAGCGNGVISCYLAKLFPESKVFGFDISEAGVECAVELAKRLEVTNIEFITADANELSSKLPIEPGSVDLIISVASLGPVAREKRAVASVPIYSVYETAQALEGSGAVSQLVSFLDRQKGLLVSYDKVGDLSSQLLWCANIQKTGLGVDLQKTSWISYDNIEQDTVTLPAIVAGLSVAQSSGNDLAAFLVSNCLEFENLSLEYGKESIAELVFSYINPKVYVDGGRAVYNDGSGTYWYEVWTAGPFALTFEHTDQGFRSLKVAPMLDRGRLKRSVDEWIEQTGSYAKVERMNAPDHVFKAEA
jgi:Methylase of polypeptide chain release factors